MVKVKLEASSRFAIRIHSPNYTTTEEDFPPEEVLLPGYPRVGDNVFDSESDASWTVKRINWPINEEIPIVIVE